MYLVLFSIVLYRTIVTVYTDNIFLYNYLRQMHQIIHPSPVGCFIPARIKTVRKNREVSGVKTVIREESLLLLFFFRQATLRPFRSCRCAKREKFAIQYGYRKWGTHARAPSLNTGAWEQQE